MFLVMLIYDLALFNITLVPPSPTNHRASSQKRQLDEMLVRIKQKKDEAFCTNDSIAANGEACSKSKDPWYLKYSIQVSILLLLNRQSSLRK